MSNSRPPLGTLCLVLPTFLSGAPLPEAPSLAQVLACGPEVRTREGRKVPLAQLLSPGQPAVVALWADGRPPGRRSLSFLAGLHRRFADRGLRVVGLGVETPAMGPESLEKVIRASGESFPAAFASPGLFALMTGHPQAEGPRILVFDAQGGVLHFARKCHFWTNARVESVVAREMRGFRGGP